MFYTYDIFNDALRLKDIIDGFFDDAPGSTGREFPLVNIYEKDDTVTIKALMPGVKSEDLNIELAGESLIISGERKSDYTESPYVRKERSFGAFKKSVRIPWAVNPNTIKAGLDRGILTLTLDKSEDAKPRKITIN